MTQVAHCRNACHARAALQCVQVALELLHRLQRRLVVGPFQQRLVRGLEKLRRFLGEDRGDFCVITRLIGHDFRHRLGLRRLGGGRGKYRDIRIDAGAFRLYCIGQAVQVFDKRGVVGPLSIRLVDVAHDRADSLRARSYRVETGAIETDLVVIDSSDQPVERRGDSHAPLNIGHVGTTVQRMARAVQLVGHIKRRGMSVASGQVVDDDLEMPCRFPGEDVVEDRVHFERRFFGLRFFAHGWLNRQLRRIRITLGKGIRSCHEQRDIGTRVRPDFELFDQFRDRGGRLGDEIDHRRRPHECPIDQFVEQILDMPGVFANAFGANHSAAALQCMEGTPHRDQCLHVVRFFLPERQLALDRGVFFLGFLDEQLE